MDRNTGQCQSDRQKIRPAPAVSSSDLHRGSLVRSTISGLNHLDTLSRLPLNDRLFEDVRLTITVVAEAD